MTIFCTFLDMVDVRGGSEHAWAQPKKTKKDIYDNFGRVFGTDHISHIKFHLLCLLLLAAFIRKAMRGVISGSQGVTDRRGLQSGSDG